MRWEYGEMEGIATDTCQTGEDSENLTEGNEGNKAHERFLPMGNLRRQFPVFFVTIVILCKIDVELRSLAARSSFYPAMILLFLITGLFALGICVKFHSRKLENW